MYTFKEYINLHLTEELLVEVLDSVFDVHHDKETAAEINGVVGDKVYPGHTAVMHSDHMRKNSNSVLRLMNKNKEIEYHFLSRNGEFEDHKLDKKSMLHSLQIIHNDSKSYLDKHHNIKLQGDNEKQTDNYHKFAIASLNKHNITNKKVINRGLTPRLDGHGSGPTIMIEGYTNGATQWSTR
jgi:hypothetical protein